MNTPPNETARLLEGLREIQLYVLRLPQHEAYAAYAITDRLLTGTPYHIDPDKRAHLATLGAEEDATDTEIVNFIEEERCDWIEFDPGYPGLGHDNATGPEPGEPPSWIIGMKGQVIAREIKFRDAIRAALRTSKQEQKP